MRILTFIVSLIITIGLITVLNKPLPLGDTQAPPLGKFLNPVNGFWKNAENINAKFPEKIDLKGLSGKAEVVYDDRLVPHIFAENIEDAIMIQGYVTAQHRLWQMDFQTRAAAGRLSEVLGTGADNAVLNYDKKQRRLGLLMGAKKAIKVWETTEEYKYLEAYTKGINAYIASLSPGDYPFEFKLLDYEPEEWTPLKSALMSKSMAQTLASYDNDLEATNALKAFGREVFDDLYPEYFPDQSPIVPDDKKWEFDAVPIISPTSTITDTLLSHKPLEKPYEGLGSNNWAVSGDKTASGNPILCNDPHLRMTLPSIWFETQIYTEDLRVYGAALPGLPFVIIGFNEDAAWGMTNVGRDVLDWYTIEWKDDTKTEYAYEGQFRPASTKIENFNVRGKGIIKDTIIYTHHGPIVHQDPKHPKHDMALRWMIHESPSGNELGAFLKLNQSKNYEDYVDAISNHDCPAQNFIFASKTGDIAIWAQGRYPLKSKEQGRFVLDGKNAANEWHGFIPQPHNPYTKNPERGFVSSANQHSTNPSYPYYYNGTFGDYRGRILNRKLTEMENIKPKDMMELQNYNYSIKAEEAFPLLVQHINAGSLSQEQRDLLGVSMQWKFSFEKDDITPILFDIWFNKTYEMIWDEIKTLDEQNSTLYPEEWRTISLMRDNPESPFFDDKTTEKVETLGDIVTNAYIAAFDEIAALEVPTWSNYKSTRIAHLARIPALSVNDIEVGGYSKALNAISEQHGPSWRMVVELGDEITAYGVYPGGQSGNPGSPFYDNLVEYWRTGQYYTLLFMTDAGESSEKVMARQTFGE